MGAHVMSGPLDGGRIADRIRKVLIEALGSTLNVDDLDFGDALQESVAMDSVAMVGFIVALEKEFGVRFETEWLDMKRLMNLPLLAEYIRQQTADTALPPDTSNNDQQVKP